MNETTTNGTRGEATMRNAILVGLMAIAMTLGACGGEPGPTGAERNPAPTTPAEVISHVDGALTAGMWLGNLGNWGSGHQFAYWNAAAWWYPRAPITQTLLVLAHPGQPTTTRIETKIVGDGITAANQIDPTVNEMTFTCNGSDMTMVDHGTYLTNANTETCRTLSHFAGNYGWRLGTTVTIAPGNLVYLQRGTDGQANGYFWVNLTVPRYSDVAGYGLGEYVGGSLPLLFYW